MSFKNITGCWIIIGEDSVACATACAMSSFSSTLSTLLHELICVDIHKWGSIWVNTKSEVISVDLAMIIGSPASCCSTSNCFLKNDLHALRLCWSIPTNKSHVKFSSRYRCELCWHKQHDDNVPISKVLKGNQIGYKIWYWWRQYALTHSQ